jgi:hypothetical protein
MALQETLLRTTATISPVPRDPCPVPDNPYYGRRLQSAATVRAFVSARHYLRCKAKGEAITLQAAADYCEANVTYTAMAVVIVKLDDRGLELLILGGVVTLPAAAASVKSTAKMIGLDRERVCGQVLDTIMAAVIFDPPSARPSATPLVRAAA